MTLDNFKKIHLGSLIKTRVHETGTEIQRICNFVECDEDDLEKFFESETIDTGVLLRFSKLLKYDFFRFYSQHLILFAPAGSNHNPSFEKVRNESPTLPQFRKNIYNREIIIFILELIDSGEKTKQQIMDDYKIPKTTLYKWISKYKKNI
ncbi:transposase [Chryseobacterium lactis]|uniref:Transposase n=1 Tax=Chryseobacterium lactis TaxID=1241981 RepID=A0A3G6RHW3_CHRLC|nr:transposase [Chryseobacterium lactis]AZA85246.1 transposase [Chryseobacterium lactis]AZB04541.1 transposase [Chryseobacterium lactis]PNW12761.1 transposase [Chryseobacterium lactis]